MPVFISPVIPASSQNKDRSYYLLGLRIAGDFGATIAVPIVLFVLVGRWLDGRYATGARYTIIAFVVAAFLSARMIYKKAKNYSKEYNALDKEQP